MEQEDAGIGTLVDENIKTEDFLKTDGNWEDLMKGNAFKEEVSIDSNLSTILEKIKLKQDGFEFEDKINIYLDFLVDKYLPYFTDSTKKKKLIKMELYHFLGKRDYPFGMKYNKIRINSAGRPFTTGPLKNEHKIILIGYIGEIFFKKAELIEKNKICYPGYKTKTINQKELRESLKDLLKQKTKLDEVQEIYKELKIRYDAREFEGIITNTPSISSKIHFNDMGIGNRMHDKETNSLMYNNGKYGDMRKT
jgi:hypothetical protein